LCVMFGPESQEVQFADNPRIAFIKERTAYRKVVEDLQRELKRLHRWPELLVVYFPERRMQFRWTSENEIVKAKLSLVELAEMNVLWRLTPCKLASCRKWFFARYKHSQFCCTPHQQTFYRQNPGWKEHRRKWSKQYRKLKASGLVK
jgi:hypothetical protein